MTPIKTIVWFGTMVGVRDFSESIELKATCPTVRDAEWLARGLANLHGVELEQPESGMIFMGVADK